MGLGGISLWQLLIILLIVVLIFGTKRLKGIGSDLGGAVKGFRNSMQDGETDAKKEQLQDQRKEDADFPENKVKDKDQNGA
ncbi:Sec-independent protein translocase subunit TatA [Wenzhouxiangella sp. XN24]|uniref:Sec-independent protein translocase subunit TatA n=1 Tax=Wenzhouxiangella sp. XN24 TaxID=2713569 RepID=UPI0013EAE196|nr:Sec-independent protein translocase subunit TatA [Wenzhouxiangella sp. XN24]NGX17485.1 Sec-independent protein translocase subunit TatA [Wenzhouxiangella sp. XN24]